MNRGLSVRWKQFRAAIAITTFSLCFSFILSSARNTFSTSKRSAILSSTSSLVCGQEQPCEYRDQVDLRIIVLTLKRPTSLLKLLQSLDVLELDEQSSALEIWIDRSRVTNKPDVRTVKVASEFQWSRGPTRVHVHPTHVGIYGQWINTWRPHDDSNDELALILEDDLSISKYAYRWLRSVYRAYSNRTDFAGASVTGYQCKTLSARRSYALLTGPKNDTVFMYKGFSSWGFVPKPRHWRRFQVGPLCLSIDCNSKLISKELCYFEYRRHYSLQQGCPTFRLTRAGLISSVAWRASMQYRPLSRRCLNVNFNNVVICRVLS